MQKKRKVDYEALSSSFMKIPYFDAENARYLMDLGYRDLFQLQGRCPENLYREIQSKHEKVPTRTLHLLRLAVYFVEHEERQREPSKLRLEAWL